jgi:hypothetical protein
MGRPGLRDHSRRAAVDITRAAAVNITRAAAVNITRAAAVNIARAAAVDGGFWGADDAADPAVADVRLRHRARRQLPQPGAGLPVPQTWTPTVPGWVTSGVTGGCLVEVWALTEDELLGLFEKLGDAIQFDESNGNFFILLSSATGLDYCSQLYNDLRTGKPVPQNIDFILGTASPQSGAVLDSVIRPASTAAAPSVFQPVPASQLASIEELPFLRQRFGYAVAEVGAAAALSQKYPAGWGAATQKSVVCRPQQGGYRCPWSYQLNGAHHSGYVLIAVTANNYRLGNVAEVGQAAPASPASSLSPLWYISIAVVVVIVAIVVAVLRRRRRATATAQ